MTGDDKYLFDAVLGFESLPEENKEGWRRAFAEASEKLRAQVEKDVYESGTKIVVDK